MISVVIPSFNEENNPYFSKTLESLQNYEVIVCDGNSTDKTREITDTFKAKFVADAGTYRADRINTGIKYATGDIVVLHHPRSFLEIGALDQLKAYVEGHPKVTWGVFTHQFDYKHPILKFTSFYSNWIRPKTQGIYYLDHCFFYIPARIDNPPILPSIPIFEDTELSRILLKSGRPIRLSKKSTTSALRFQKNGILKQGLLNQVMKAMYLLGYSKEKMDQIYEAGLKLNSK